MGFSLFFYEDFRMDEKAFNRELAKIGQPVKPKTPQKQNKRRRGNMNDAMVKFMDGDFLRNTVAHERQREAAIVAEQGFCTTQPKKPVKRDSGTFKADLKDHEFRELVNDLRDIAKKYHDYGCLRELIAERLHENFSK